MATQRWLQRPLDPRARVRLFCFPYAGGGSLIYRGWRRHLPADIDVCAVQLPGRENRLGEPPFRALDPLVDAAVDALAPALDRPVALFGHSMGALVAYAVARRLEAAGIVPLHLFASGAGAPDLRRPGGALHTLPDPELVTKVLELGGTPADVVASPELLAVVLPTLRADFAVGETYAHRAAPPLACPITAFGGVRDTLVSRERLHGWRAHTRNRFRVHVVDGDHFFIRGEPLAVLSRITAELSSAPLVREAS